MVCISEIHRMTIIFDLQQSGTTWADSVNEALKADWPEYIKSNGLVGSHQWWQNYHAKAVPHEKKAGVVTFIGERVDEFDEQYDSDTSIHPPYERQYKHWRLGFKSRFHKFGQLIV